MEANIPQTTLVLVYYVHTDCHGYYPAPPSKCSQLRAEQLPWVTEGNGRTYTTTVAQRAQERLRDRIQELVVARASVGHADYPEMVTEGLKMKICCELKGVYPLWEGYDNIRGPDLLTEEPTTFANQLTLISRRGFIDSLVVEFFFGLDSAPKVQLAQPYPFSPRPMRQGPRLLPNSPVANVVTTTTTTTYKPPDEQQG